MLVCLQVGRWRRQSRSQRALRWVRRGLCYLLVLEAAHAALLAGKLDRLLRLYIGAETSGGRHDVLLPRLELAARYAMGTVGGAVFTAFTWRGYQITKKLHIKVLLIGFWVLTSASAWSWVLETITVVETASLFSLWIEMATCGFSWLALGQNITLVAMFYKELVVDRCGGAARRVAPEARTGHTERHINDAVTSFAVEALSHQVPLIVVTLGGSIAAARFSLEGLWSVASRAARTIRFLFPRLLTLLTIHVRPIRINQFFMQLYSPVFLLSGITALLSHDNFRKRCTSSQEITCQHTRKHTTSLGRHRHQRRNSAGDDPSLWRADMSVHHAHEQIRVEQVTSYVVDEPDEDDSKSPTWRAGPTPIAVRLDEDYFNFNLTALDKSKPALMSPTVRFEAKTMPGPARPARPRIVIHSSYVELSATFSRKAQHRLFRLE